MAEPGYCSVNELIAGYARRLGSAWGHWRTMPHQGLKSPPARTLLNCRIKGVCAGRARQYGDGVPGRDSADIQRIVGLGPGYLLGGHIDGEEVR
ncbi:hypothetical protein Ait01nite_088160 [Actinoplanes italicus]|nr:hypothetical protein Ait01nite_088160 [Actinoplanes italicus]